MIVYIHSKLILATSVIDVGKLELMVEGNELLRVMTTPGVNGYCTTSNHELDVAKSLGLKHHAKRLSTN